MKRFGKAAIALIGSTCTLAVATLGPENKWGVLASSVLAALTAFGVYQIPYYGDKAP